MQSFDPSTVRTREELADALNALRNGRGHSYEAMVRASRAVGAKAQLARSTVGDILSAKTMPRRETLLAFLRVCEVPPSQIGAWLGAWERAMSADLIRPCGATHVRDADPRLLGVHAAITADSADAIHEIPVAGADDDGAAGQPGPSAGRTRTRPEAPRESEGALPVYVRRDFDDRLRAAVTSGCFLLLVGSSSVGKTRSAFEAIRACVPDWRLVHPPDADAVRALAQSPLRRTVVWLDELQRFLGNQGITGATMRALRAGGAIVIGTIWPEIYLDRSVSVRWDDGGSDDDRELLKLAHVIDVATSFTDQERQRATALAAFDRRLRIALSTMDIGPTQVLAAGPAIVRRWMQAPDPYAKAVITAAADARRMGAWSALRPEFFEAAVIGYLTPAQRAVAPAGWLDTAFAYALIPVHGAATTLTPVPADGRRLGVVAGYVVADYLLEYARRARRTTPVPDACWEALLEHTHNRADLHRLAGASRKRMRPDRAEQCYRRLATEGDEQGALSLADLLREQGRTDEEMALLRQLAATNPDAGTRRLANALRAASRIEEAIALLAPPEEGTWRYAQGYVEAMTANGRRNEAMVVLRLRAAEHADAVHELADHLAAQGAPDELWALFQRYPQYGYLAWQAGWLRLRAGRIEEGLDAIRAIAGSDALDAAETFARLLVEHGRIDELRTRAYGGDSWSARWLAEWLSDNGQADELADLADRYSDGSPLEHLLSNRLAEALFDQGNVERLRARADAGCRSARYRWAELMIEHGRIEEVRARADAGGRPEAIRLAQMYETTGSLRHAIEVLRGHPDLACQLADLLAKAGRLDEAIDVIRPRATEGHRDALSALHGLLVRAGRDDELRSRGKAGDLGAYAALAYALERAGRIDEAIEALTARFAFDQGENRGFRLAELLQREGRLDELWALADQGSWHAQRHLSAQLAAHGAVDELLSRAQAEDGGLYRIPLVDLLTAQDRVDELRDLAVRRDQYATRHYLQILARQGRTAELREEVEAGTDGAAQRLTTLLRRQHGQRMR
ncbi:hypothetical protein [Dactylosporangium salmoneum]|uniref:HTH cro/C1-type domain-containing protein n=1 Tax=Dactylosporangium salmoneum TaxID=53361 RepID=A0ABP5SBA6_9ACTN